MPNINFSAPVIRLGTSGSQRSGNLDSLTGRRDGGTPLARRGIGMDDREGRREDARPLHPPTREEIARTIFVGNIPPALGDAGIERILETAGAFTRFTRAKDANDKVQTFGFAEYGDAQSLRTATELFQDVQIPTKRQTPGEKKDRDEVETTKLQIVIDDASIKYAEDWTKNEDEEQIQFRLDSAKEALDRIVAQLFNPPDVPQADLAEDAMMMDAQHEDNPDIVQIDITANGEDDLSDIPAEMRETVAAEIAAFRDRSNQRDLERLRKEEAESGGSSSVAGGANGVPVGPRADRGVQGAPSGPKGSQFPRDYQGNMKFVNGEAMINGGFINREDDDDSASDSELEQRRKMKRNAEHDVAYERELSRWLKHEGRSGSALERTHNSTKHKEAEEQKAREAMGAYLKNFDDDEEEARKHELYYRDHGAYMRERQRHREREEREDAIDRDQEESEMATRQKQKAEARDQANAFLDAQAEEMLRVQTPREPQSAFKISLGAATKKLDQKSAPRRTAADVENLLEDEETADPADTKKRTLIPINFDAAVRANLTQEEVEDAQKQLARDIPADKDGLWKWPVSWEHLPDKNVDEDIKKWAANKVLDLLGVQEDMLVDTVVEHLRSHGGAQSLVENLEPVSGSAFLPVNFY
jgi:RNA-binding protein 25